MARQRRRRAGIAGADQRPAEREIADPVSGVEALVADLPRAGQEIAAEARARPGRAHRPARVAGLRAQGSATRCRGSRRRSRRQSAWPARPLASTQAKKPRPPLLPPPGCSRSGWPPTLTLRIGAEPARIAEAEAQLGAAQVHLRRLDAGAREVGREGEARLAATPARHRRPLRRSSACGPAGRTSVESSTASGARVSSRITSSAAGDALAVLDDRFGRGRAIGDDQHRSVDRLRAAPAVGDRSGRLVATASGGRRPAARPRRAGWSGPGRRRSPAPA